MANTSDGDPAVPSEGETLLESASNDQLYLETYQRDGVDVFFITKERSAEGYGVQDSKDLKGRSGSSPGRGCPACPSVDPHWGWVVAAAVFVANFLMNGFSFSCGLFYVEWMEYFEDSNSVSVSLISALNLGLFGLAGPVGAILSQRFGDRQVVIIASIFTSAAMVMSAIYPNIYILIVTIGILAGTGISVAFNTYITLPVRYFEKGSTGLVIGIVSSGGGFGILMMPLITEKLIELYGWQGALIFLGGLNLHCCVCGALLRPMKEVKYTERQGEQKLVDWSILKHSSFMLLATSVIFYGAGVGAVFVHIVATAESMVQINRNLSAVLISAVGIANCLGRLTHGALATKVNPVSQYCISYILAGAALFIFPLIPSYPVLVLLGAIFGFFTAPYVTVSQLVMARMVGAENLKFAWSIFICFSGIGFISGPPLAGVFYNFTGDYRNTMYLSGVMITGQVIFLIKPWIDSRKGKSYDI